MTTNPLDEIDDPVDLAIDAAIEAVQELCGIIGRLDAQLAQALNERDRARDLAVHLECELHSLGSQP